MPPTPQAQLPSLCIINYNGSAHLSSTLSRVLELRDQFSSIVLVDDASTDDSVRVARSMLDAREVVALRERSGPAVARNVGLGVVDADRVLFLDNDVVLDPGAVPALMDALDTHPRAVMAMPRIVSADNAEHVEYDGGSAHFSGLLVLRNAGADARLGGPVSPVGSLVTCCFLFARDRWGPGPLFDESFFIYLEDHELGLRARLLGRELLVVPRAIGLHGKGTPGLSIRATGRHTHTRIVHTILHRWLLLLKLYQLRTLVLLAPYLILFELFQLAAAVSLGWGREWLTAVGKLSRSIPQVLRSRAAFSRERRLPDVAVLESGGHPFNPALKARAGARWAISILDTIAALNWAALRLLSKGRVAS